jgi:BirA family biotin operon repressor/biotin-[acetyl-CoA-carboxylase] ligase
MDWEVRRFDEIDSTNRWLSEQARAGAPAGLAAVADHQTAGRGRLGRTWEAPPGSNLLMSLLLRPDGLSADRRHLVVASVAVAAVKALERLTPQLEVGIKWPNDLVVEDRKLAGVLAESTPDGAVVVGIGVNLGWAPEGAARAAEVGRDELASALLAEVSEDWDAVAADYRHRCVTIGRQVRVEMPDETFTGTAVDVDDEGHLLVDVGMCLRTVSAADVIHLR